MSVEFAKFFTIITLKIRNIYIYIYIYFFLCTSFDFYLHQECRNMKRNGSEGTVKWYRKGSNIFTQVYLHKIGCAICHLATLLYTLYKNAIKWTLNEKYIRIKKIFRKKSTRVLINNQNNKYLIEYAASRWLVLRY